MNLDRYEYETKRTYKEYFFYSEGPKGRIRKVVRFALMYNYPALFYNLIFGDWNETDNSINVRVVTNNGDAEKVLATVGRIILDFTGIFKSAIICIKGSNDARNRLYQIGLNKYWNEIDKMLYVYGCVNKEIKPFQKNITYAGFLISREEFFIGHQEYFIFEEQTQTYMISSQKNNKERKRVYNDRVVDGPDEVDENSPAIREKMEDAKRSLEELGFVAAGFCMKPESELEK